jgi:hypothetical protein
MGADQLQAFIVNAVQYGTQHKMLKWRILVSAGTLVTNYVPHVGVHADSNHSLGVLKCYGNASLLYPPSTSSIRSRSRQRR